MAMKLGFLSGIGKEPTEMDLVMENITRVDDEIQQKTFQLGQVYYEEHKEDSKDKYYDLINAITKLDYNRKSFYKNKLRLQGQMMCESCGAVLPYGSVFCSACGKRADEKQENGVSGNAGGKRCAKCGAAVETGSLFCTVCGERIE